MQLLFRVVVIALLGWQAVAFAVDEAGRITNPQNPGWGVRLGATTDERVARVLGPDAEIWRTLRAAVPPRATVLNRQVQGTVPDLDHVRALETKAKAGDEAALRELLDLQAAFERLSARNGLFVQLTALSFPDPFFVSVADPIALVESEVAAGRDPWLFVLDGDPEPTDRAGWTCARREPRFRLWRFQKA